MKVAFFSTRPYDQEYFEGIRSPHDFTFITETLDRATAHRADKAEAVCLSTTDQADEAVIKILDSLGIRLIMVRASGLDNVDTEAAYKTGIAVRYLPGYSPRAIAEHAATLLLSLNRKIRLSHERMLSGDFTLDGLIGMNLYHKTVGIVGIGRVGQAFASIMKGFGCRILACDIDQNKDYTQNEMKLVSLRELLSGSEVVSLHCSLNDSNEEIINRQSLQQIKPGAVLINTARGRLVANEAILEALDNGLLSGYGADVYTGENPVFYRKFPSLEAAGDPLLTALLKHPRVLLTPHQAFFTREAMQQIARTVVNELTYFESMAKGMGNQLMI